MKSKDGISPASSGLLLAATAKEIAPFIQWYRSAATATHRNWDILVTGVGMTATTYSLASHLGLKRPGLIIQAGIAGSFSASYPPGSVLAVKQDTIADLGVWENNKWKSLFDLQLANKNTPPYSGGWLVNRSGLLPEAKVPKVKSVTVNQVTTSPAMIRAFCEQFNPVTESMEGAALHYVCLMEKIPFLQLRAVSNFAGERSKRNWKIKEAVENLNRELIRLISTV